MTSGLINQCLLCVQFRSPLDTEQGGRRCNAFPAGIPGEIWENRADHRKPFPGDHGIRWAPDGDVEFPRHGGAVVTPLTGR